MTDQEKPREDPPRRGYATIIREAEEFSRYWHGIGNPSTNFGNAISTIDELLGLHKRMSASHEPHELSFEALRVIHRSAHKVAMAHALATMALERGLTDAEAIEHLLAQHETLLEVLTSISTRAAPMFSVSAPQHFTTQAHKEDPK